MELKRKKHSRYSNLTIGIVLISLLILVAIFANVISPFDYTFSDLGNRFQAPSAEHLFGTDNYGRDVFSRVIFGSRIAIKVAVISVAIQLALGVTIGLISGFFGGWVDRLFCFIMDLSWAVPPLIMAFAVIAIIGKTLDNAIIAIAVVSWAGYSRVVRAKTKSLKNMAFVETAVAYGESNLAIMFRYIFPNIVSSIVVIASMSIPGAIMSTTALSYLGLGAQSPSPDWGLALSESMTYITKAPWLGLFPGIALVLTTYGFMMLGEGIRDVLDPHMKSM